MDSATPPARLLLKLSHGWSPDGLVASALEALERGRISPDGWIELSTVSMQEPLRCLDRACRIESVGGIVLAERSESVQPGAPYARLWDRTDEFAKALAAWCNGGAFPRLKAGELIRLPV